MTLRPTALFIFSCALMSSGVLGLSALTPSNISPANAAPAITIVPGDSPDTREDNEDSNVSSPPASSSGVKNVEGQKKASAGVESETENAALPEAASSDPASDPAASGPAASDPASKEVPSGQLSLGVTNAPLLQLLNLLSVTTGVRFRYTTPPDVVVSATFNDASGMSVEKLIGAAGWHARPSAGDRFLYPNRAVAWKVWSRTTPPPRHQLAAPSKVAVALKPRGGGRSGPLQSTTSRVGSDDFWKSLTLKVEGARRPGIELIATPTTTNSAAAGATTLATTGAAASATNGMGAGKETWIRLALPLKFVPGGTKLLLETARPADFSVNGAPLARRWTGLRLFDLSRVLQRGENILVVHWPATTALSSAPSTVARQTNGASSATSSAALSALSSATSSDTLLRYEWVFDAGVASGEVPPDIDE
jgi:hypothetical protein